MWKKMTAAMLFTMACFGVPAAGYVATPYAVEAASVETKTLPAGISSIHWGDTSESVRSRYETKKFEEGKSAPGITQYMIFIPEAKGDFYFMGPVSVLGTFDHDRLVSITIPTGGEINTRIMGLIKRYGEPKRHDSRMFLWETKDTMLFVQKAGTEDALFYIYDRNYFMKLVQDRHKNA